MRVLYVSSTDHNRYKRHLPANVDRSLENEQLPPEQRFQLLHTASLDVLAESFQQRDPELAVRGASDVGQRRSH